MVHQSRKIWIKEKRKHAIKEKGVDNKIWSLGRIKQNKTATKYRFLAFYAKNVIGYNAIKYAEEGSMKHMAIKCVVWNIKWKLNQEIYLCWIFHTPIVE